MRIAGDADLSRKAQRNCYARWCGTVIAGDRRGACPPPVPHDRHVGPAKR